jgi:hypothetical protein
MISIIARVYAVRPFETQGGKPAAFVRIGTPKAFIQEGSNETEHFMDAVVYQENIVKYLQDVFSNDTNKGLPMQFTGRFHEYVRPANSPNNRSKQTVAIKADQLKEWGFAIANNNTLPEIKLEFPVAETVRELVLDTVRKIPGVTYARTTNNAQANSEPVAVSATAVASTNGGEIPTIVISENDLPF